MTQEIQLVKVRDVEKMLGVSRATVYRMMKHGHFPRPIHIAPSSVRWERSVIDQWLEARRADVAA